MLLPTIKNAVIQEQSSKRYALMALGSSGLKVVLALLTEVVTFYVQVAIIKITVPGF